MVKSSWIHLPIVIQVQIGKFELQFELYKCFMYIRSNKRCQECVDFHRVVYALVPRLHLKGS